MKELIANVLKRLQSKEAIALELLPVYKNPDHEALWRRDARLYRAFARRLIDQGHPTRSFELAREGLSCHSDDLELKYLLALAMARGGNPRSAQKYLLELMRMPDTPPKMQIEALSLEGRLYKNHFARERDPTLKAKYASLSAASYHRAAKLEQADSFPLINTATMTLLAGDEVQAKKYARKAIAKAQKELPGSQNANGYWISATLGEAHLILGQFDKAATWYRQAIAAAKEQGDIGSISSMRQNALLLKEKLLVDDELLRLFYLGSVVAFSGHMIDHPKRASQERLPPRFPSDPQLIREVSEVIRTNLDKLNTTVGFCSAACGADLLFAQEMLDRNAELHIVIPFAVNDFYLTSVDFGLPAMSVWKKQFELVLERVARIDPTHIHFATKESYLGHDVLFEFVTHFTQGLAITRAAERGVVPQALVILDSKAQTKRGGAGYFLDVWTKMKLPAETIDIREIRQRVLNEPITAKLSPQAVPVGPLLETERKIKAMLFADVKDFSKLSEGLSADFFGRFLTEVHSILRSLKHRPTFSNTWGDGLYLVFDKATHCAEAALRLLETTDRFDWEEFGLQETNPLRIGLHAGPVFSGYDPIIGKKNYYGSHVTRAARIEPVTIPGCAFISEQFAALLAIEPAHDFACEYIGIEYLAKKYDLCPLYRLVRR